MVTPISLGGSIEWRCRRGIAARDAWLAFFFVSDSKDPTFTIANIVMYALPGLITYPAGWYMIIFCRRDYSVPRTMALVVATFVAVSVVVAVLMLSFGLYISITGLLTVEHPQGPPLGVSESVVLSLVITAMGATILIFPYMIVATPIALFHRRLLLILFASSGSPPIYQE